MGPYALSSAAIATAHSWGSCLEKAPHSVTKPTESIHAVTLTGLNRSLPLNSFISPTVLTDGSQNNPIIFPKCASANFPCASASAAQLMSCGLLMSKRIVILGLPILVLLTLGQPLGSADSDASGEANKEQPNMNARKDAHPASLRRLDCRKAALCNH